MNDLRAWAGVLMVVVFLVGAAAGVLWQRSQELRPEGGPHEDYARLIEREFGLAPERMGYLRVLLREYDQDVQRVRLEHEEAFHAALEPDLRPLSEEYNRLVRDMVLPGHQRARFDELAAGFTFDPLAQ